MERAAGGSVAAAISNATVRLLSRYTGRGPNRARTTINRDHVTIILRDALTKGERSLVADGRHELVLEMRRNFQQTMRDDLVAIVEQWTGRRVIAFMSDNHIDPDIAVEVFVLEPEGGEAEPDLGVGEANGRAPSDPSGTDGSA